MATVFRKTFTKPLHEGAELFTRKGQRFARWKDTKDKTRIAKVTVPEKGKNAGKHRIVMAAGTFTAKFRDGQGVVREVATGCRSEQAARQVLADLVKRTEHVKGGILTVAQDAMIDHQGTPLAEHFDAYLGHMESKGTTGEHRKTTRAYLDRIAADCSFSKLADLDRTAVERWLTARMSEGVSARSRNGYRVAIVAFANWCTSTERLAANPLAGIPKANEKADPRRHRRAMTEAELVKLLEVARQRPLLEAMTVRRGKNKGKPLAEVRPETQKRLERLGRERVLTYKTLVLTGLRSNELRSLTVGQLELDGPTPRAMLHAADEKNRQGSWIPLRDDLAADLRAWIADELATDREEARRRGAPIPARLASDRPLFTVPRALVKILDRDLVMAGIARKVRDPETGKVRIDKRDGRGWTLDVHALRTTFCSLLSKGGVPLRTAQAAMRHGDPSLTANTYTDPVLLDVAGAMDALPNLPLDGSKAEQRRATGTCDDGPLVPTLAPDWCKRGQTGANADKTPKRQEQLSGCKGVGASAAVDKGKRPSSFPDNGRPRSGRLDLNQRPLDPQSSTLTKLSYAPSVLAQSSELSAGATPVSRDSLAPVAVAISPRMIAPGRRRGARCVSRQKADAQTT